MSPIAQRARTGRRDPMTVEFSVDCPDCGHTLLAVANPGNPYDWDFEDCICQARAYRKRP